MLVIACPCALVIATPVTVVSGLAAAARKGILMKGGVYLEEARKIKVVALDKTGTVTEGKPRLLSVKIIPSSFSEVTSCHGRWDWQTARPIPYPEPLPPGLTGQEKR